MVFRTLKSLLPLYRLIKLNVGIVCRLFVELSAIFSLIYALEQIGRFSHSDYHDLAVLFSLLPLFLFAIYFHHKTRIQVLSSFSIALKAFLNLIRSHICMDIGADFRAQKPDSFKPPLPYRDLSFCLLFIVSLCTFLIPYNYCFPECIRFIKTKLAYTPYLIITYTLWTLLFSFTALDVVIVGTLFSNYVLKSPFVNPKSTSNRLQYRHKFYIYRLSFLICLVMGLAFLTYYCRKTAFFHLMALASLLTLLLAYLRRTNETVRLIIRKAISGRFESISISEWNFSFYAAIQLVCICLFILSTGAGPNSIASLGAMPFTHFLGTLFGILSTLASLFYLFAAVDFLDFKRLISDPAIPRQNKLLFKSGDLPPNFHVDGWQLSPTTKPACNVTGDLYYAPGKNKQPHSNICIISKSILSLNPAERSFYLHHCDYISKRRTFYRGLRRLLKICHAYKFRDGAGFIMIPHCYFVEGLHRDDRNVEFEENRPIGPSFHELWGVRVRHYLYRVLNALDVDIVYFEDGVKYDQLRAVFEILFELYHSRGPRFKIEDHHFTGIQGIRVMLELLRPDAIRPKVSQYVETYFSNLFQARVLILYRDRGGESFINADRTPGRNLDIPAAF